MNNFISNYANIPNPITKFFNKIFNFKLYGSDDRENIEWLEDMKKVPLYVKCIEICSNNVEELENLTDPNLHNTPISNLKLTLLNRFNISSKTIENLQSIYPNSIRIEVLTKTQDESTKKVLFENFTKLLSNMDHTSLEMDFNKKLL